MENEKITIVKSYLDAAMKGDHAAELALFSPDVKYKIPGHNLLAGEFTGPQPILDTLPKMHELSGGTHGMDEILDWLTSEQRVIFFTREHADRHGRHFNWVQLVQFDFDPQNKITGVSLYQTDQDTFDACWS